MKKISRILLAEDDPGIADVVSIILKNDNEINILTTYIFNKSPWDSSLYDILIPIDKVSLNETVTLIVESIEKKLIQFSKESEQAVSDFKLASKLKLTLIEKGHDVKVVSKNYNINIIIDKHTMRLKKLSEELKEIIRTVEGVGEISIETGPNFNDAIYRRYSFEEPSKVLVVDDERDFALTLSKRLQLRDVGSAAVFSGEDALNIIEEEMPEVLILDLKMGGIDGMEVLRSIKAKYPNIEVIMLTGHGSEAVK